jgi:hypothetical protein
LKKALENKQYTRRSARSRPLTNVLRILALLAVIAITVFIYNIRDRVVELPPLGTRVFFSLL